jgi:DNA repair protein RecO (recombination protein O)
MFVHYRTQGLIIKKEERGQADLLFTIYTKDFGKVEVLGKAIRKVSSKLKSGAELFYFSEIEFIQGKTHKTLTDAILIEKFSNIRKDLRKLSVAFKVSEVLDGLVQGQEQDEKIWKLLVSVMLKLNSVKNIEEVKHKIYYYFFWNLISLMGYGPDLREKAFCGDQDAVKILRIILRRDWRTLERVKLREENIKSMTSISDHYLKRMLEHIK